ncbi:MAG TPA: hypothetical protein PK055_08035 [Gammaproteobacteria bacterium]|nr:hypothetical protein [Xanthomonadales bacterium]MCB1595728.1 hypothetical protein [Xanthomonadales bacterium]HPI95731.1 hypothetical protein [Gammaproteobacteria bacterium]HPQ87592.1 hypothetical protein [Gammaproteobacteria bacterium]
MKKYFILLTILMFNGYSSEYLVRQGEVEISIEDVAGFIYQLPPNVRKGFLEDITRLDSTLKTLLNYKHVYNYVIANDLFDVDELATKIKNEILQYDFKIGENFSLIEKDVILNQITDFFIVRNVYRKFQDVVLNSISDEELVDMAEEYYTINHKNYLVPESRGIIYLSVMYSSNENDRKLKTSQLSDLRKRLINDGKQLSEINEIELEEIGAILSDEIENYIYDPNQEEFSKYVFSMKEKGIQKDILALNENLLLLVEITSVDKEHQIPFQEVKEDLLKQLKMEKAERDINNILLKITNDKVEVNESKILDLRTYFN